MKDLQSALGSASPDVGARLRPDPWLAVAVTIGLLTGVAVARGDAPLIAAATVAVAAMVAALLRPELVLIAWFVAILADGRWLTYHRVGPLYVTEPLLALLCAGVVLRLLLGWNELDSPGRRRALRFLTLLSLVVFVPALAGLLIKTSAFDYAAARNWLLIMYVLFALIVAYVTDLERTYRLWFVGVLLGSTIALLLVVGGHAGSGLETSTGATRIASHTFVLAFGIAPLVIAAALREGLVRPVVAVAAAAPFVVGLVLVNHRSAWLAFVVAAVVVFLRRLTPTAIVGGLAVVVCGIVLLTTPIDRNSVFGEEIARVKTVTSTSDPNAHYRLEFWKAVLAESVRSPLFGGGFDQYPARLVPPSTIDPEGDLPAPHNSFVAIAYRIGLIPLLILLLMLGNLLLQGFRASVAGSDTRDRATCLALTSIVVYVGVVSAFNVFLEAPYAGPLFWTAVGLLAYAVYADPFGRYGSASAREVISSRSRRSARRLTTSRV